MKNSIYSTLIIAALSTGLLFSSCQSSEKKVDTAENKMQDAKDDLAKTQNEAAAEAKKTADAEAWKVFKAESDLRINENDVIIADLKAKKQTAGKKIDAIYAKSIAEMEQKNKDMKMRIDNYDKNNTDWNSFKSEFNHDMDGLGQAIKDLGVNNKK
jgi:hypothetical protein